MPKSSRLKTLRSGTFDAALITISPGSDWLLAGRCVRQSPATSPGSPRTRRRDNRELPTGFLLISSSGHCFIVAPSVSRSLAETLPQVHNLAPINVGASVQRHLVQ